jgi:hypothetical protein
LWQDFLLEGWGISLLFCFYRFKNNTRKQKQAMCCFSGGAKIVTQKTTEVWRAWGVLSAYIACFVTSGF